MSGLNGIFTVLMRAKISPLEARVDNIEQESSCSRRRKMIGSILMPTSCMERPAYSDVLIYLIGWKLGLIHLCRDRAYYSDVLYLVLP